MRKSYLAFFISFIFLGTVSFQIFAEYQWEQLAHFPTVARHRCAAFAIGNTGYFGLGHYNSQPGNIIQEDFWAYDPASNTWTQKASYPNGPTYHTADFVVGNKAYVGTGRTPVSFGIKLFFEYDPQTNQWTQKADFPGTGRRASIGFAIGDYGYIGSGSGGGDFYQYDPLNDQWTQVATLFAAQDLSEFVIGNNAYVGAGGNTNFYRYTPPPTDAWLQIASMPSTPQFGTWRTEATGFAINDTGYIVAGASSPSGSNFRDMYAYHPGTNTWDTLPDFGGQARRYLETFVIGEKAYAGLGTDGTNFNDFWVWEYAPPKDTTQTGFENALSKSFEVTVYPNPIRDKAIISVGGHQIANWAFELYNLQGKMVTRLRGTTPKITLYRNNLPAGVYVYTVMDESSNISTGKLILN